MGPVVLRHRRLEVEVDPRGARLTRLLLDGENMVRDQYPYAGAVCGRFANRIGGSRFALDGQEVPVTPGREGGAHLHGGDEGFDQRLWTVEQRSDQMVELSYTSADGEEGYPGEMRVSVTYSIQSPAKLVIWYHATTTKATVVNLTSHCYFNLCEAEDSIENHRLQVFADAYTPVDEHLIPTGEIRHVRGSEMDLLLEPQLLSEKLWLDHNFVLNNGETCAAELTCGNKTLIVRTSEPGLQVYAGAKGGVCLETQHFPDSPNHANFPSTTLRPGQSFSSWTKYIFSIKDQ